MKSSHRENTDRVLKHIRPPTSGRIIGALVNMLDDRPGLLGSKQAQRYFKDDVDNVTVQYREQILDALADELGKTGLFPDKFRGTSTTSKDFLSSLIKFHSVEWDRLCGYMYSQSGRVYEEIDAMLPYLRLIVVDLVVRGIALLWLLDEPEPGDNTPIWATKMGAAHHLRRLIGNSGHTRESFAVAVGVSDTTVDNWLDHGTRPRHYYIQCISEVLAETDGERTKQWYSQTVGRIYWLSALADQLSTFAGRETVEMLARALCVLITRILPDVRSVEPSSDEVGASVQLETLMLGAKAKRALPLLRILWKEERNPIWKVDIQAAAGNWTNRIQNWISMVGTPDGDGPVLHNPGIAFQVHQELNQIVLGSLEAIAEGQKDVEANTQVLMTRVIQNALEANQTDPWLHSQLGYQLYDSGDFDGAIHENRIAAVLKPDWINPVHQIAAIYIRAGRLLEAREHLETFCAAREDPPWSNLFMLRMCLSRLGDHRKGLDLFRRALNSHPNHPQILALASRSCNELGKHADARRYERRALLFGF